MSGISPLRTVENPRILDFGTGHKDRPGDGVPVPKHAPAGRDSARRELVWCFSQAQNMWVFHRVFVSPEKRWDYRHDKDL